MVESSAARVRLIAELLADSLKLSGTARLRVFGTSMIPAVWPGDELEIRGIRRNAAEPKAARAGESASCVQEQRVCESRLRIRIPVPAVGEIVLFTRDGRLFAHRVIECRNHNGSIELVTRGDALSACDPPISISQVLGRVTAIRRHGRLVPLNPQRTSLPTRLIGRAVRQGSPLRRAILKLHALHARTRV